MTSSTIVSPSSAGIDVSAALEVSFMESLRTNDCVSEEDAELFDREILSVMHSEINLVDQQMDRVRMQWEDLANSRQQMVEIWTQWRHRVASPLRRLPAEVLVEIFQWCCDGFELLDPRSGPWPLAQVCKRWRQLAFETSPLWAYFSFNPGSLVEENYELLPRLRTALSYSKSHAITFDCDLTLYVDDMRPSLNEHPRRLELAKMLFLNLALVSERWRDAYLRLHDMLLPLLDRLQGKIPLLITMDIGTGEPFELDLPGSAFPVATVFEGAPQLRDVTLHRMVFERVRLPTLQLERLRLSWGLAYWNTDEIPSGAAFQHLHYLTDCPNLRHLDVVHDFNDDWMDDGIFLHPPLMNSSITTLRCADVRFMRSIALPNLRELHIVSQNEYGSYDMCPREMSSAVAGFLERSKCPLEFLMLQDPKDVDAMRNLLGLVPHLKVLRLWYNYWDAEMDVCLTSIFACLAEPSMALALEAIIVIVNPSYSEMPHTVHFIGPEFSKFVQQRWVTPALTRIGKISVDIYLAAELRYGEEHCGISELCKQLSKYQEEGLNVSIRTVGTFPNKAFHGLLFKKFMVETLTDGNDRMIYV